MNDLTRKELEWLAGHFSYWNEDFEAPEILTSIRNKFSKMIDNYCEHKNKCTDGAILVCEDCGKEW